MKGLKILSHHSVGDWDFLKVSDWSTFTNWGLYLPFFVSPPSCLYIGSWPLGEEIYVLSNLPLTQNVTAGRLTTWVRRQMVGVGKAHVHIGVTGAGDRGIDFVLFEGTDDFRRRRFDWWQGFDLHNDPATLVDEYHWTDEAWNYIERHYKPPMSGLTNRIGIGTTHQALASIKYFDDTEIWLPI